MEKFQHTAKINANKTLTLIQKVLLNYVISFIENDKQFYGTNQNISEAWDIPMRSVERHIQQLKNFGLIKSEIIRKKHTDGASQWYNKRYLKVDFSVLVNFLNGIIISQNEIGAAQAEIIAETAPIEQSKPSRTILTTEPIIFGNYDEQDTMTDEVIAKEFGLPSPEPSPEPTPEPTSEPTSEQSVEQPDNGLTIEQMISNVRNSPELSSLGKTILTNYPNWDRDRMLGFYDIWINKAAEKILESKSK